MMAIKQRSGSATTHVKCIKYNNYHEWAQRYTTRWVGIPLCQGTPTQLAHTLTDQNKCSLGVGPILEDHEVPEVQHLLCLVVHPQNAFGANSQQHWLQLGAMKQLLTRLLQMKGTLCEGNVDHS